MSSTHRFHDATLLFAMLVLVAPSGVHGAVARIVESFDGTGEFNSSEGVVSGLDNPDWFISGNGELEDGGYAFVNAPGIEESENDEAERIILGRGGFVSRMEIRNLDLSEIGEDSFASSWIRLRHIFGELSESELLNIFLEEGSITDSSSWALSARAGSNRFGLIVPRGDHLVMQVAFDAATSVATFSYDNDIDDANPGVSFELGHVRRLADRLKSSSRRRLIDDLRRLRLRDGCAFSWSSSICYPKGFCQLRRSCGLKWPSIRLSHQGHRHMAR